MYKTLHKKQGSVTVQLRFARSSVTFCAKRDRNEAVTTQKRCVRHPKYGTGSVVREDDMMITVDFDDYGEKELMKMFGGLEELS